jgi:NAD(P)-dependent dehydrogenase (short-subunit alcohol dehydrogenase family)
VGQEALSRRPSSSFDGDGYYYRGHFFYDLVKTTVIRMAFGLSQELAHRGIPVVAVTPGFLRSEWMLDHFGVTEASWRDAAKKVREFIAVCWKKADDGFYAYWGRTPYGTPG